MVNGLLRIPAVGAKAVQLYFSKLPRTGDFNIEDWQKESLSRSSPAIPGEWWEINLDSLNLMDGSYEYLFKIVWNDQNFIFVTDPYAEKLTKFGGYRGVFQISGGQRYRLSFSWQGEIPAGVRLPENNEMIIYELPMRWVDSPPDGQIREIGLGTFDKALFEHIDYLSALGINAIEILPAQDSPDTLTWGYGTRFFFSPDLDLGESYDFKLFIKECHKRGIRVILDVVMNHSRSCPLETMAFDMFYLKSGYDEKDDKGDPRDGWGGQIFRYREKAYGDFHARNFQLGMGEFWIKEYHVDGFRVDEFKGINNWDFILQFHDHCWEIQKNTFPGRPFIVVAEDSWRRPEVAQDLGSGKVADAIWDFDSRDEIRRLVGNRIDTNWGEPSRSDRVTAVIKGNRCFDNGSRNWRRRPEDNHFVEVGFTDLSQRILYNTSHDVQNPEEQRIFPHLISKLKSQLQYWDSIQPDKDLDTAALSEASKIVSWALEQTFATFAFILTSPGIPMFLTGEEFGDLHDLDPKDWKLKMLDPVDWLRANLPGHKELLGRVKQITYLRSKNRALQRNEVEFFGLKNGFHPSFDANDGERVFEYCRTGGQPLGSASQVIVIANCSSKNYPSFGIDWPWGNMMLNESGGLNQNMPKVSNYNAELALYPYQVRIFAT